MNSSVDVQAAYNDLFSNMRNYIWDLDVVELLADVEVDTYDAFIDKEKLQKDYQKLYTTVVDEARNNKDEELEKAADAFKDIIEQAVEDEEPAYFELYQVQETTDVPEEREEIAEEEEDLSDIDEFLLDLDNLEEEPEEAEIPEEEEETEEEETE